MPLFTTWHKERNVELGNLAVHFTLTQPEVDVHLIGMPTKNYVDNNLKILINGLSDYELEVTREINERYLVFFSYLRLIV